MALDLACFGRDECARIAVRELVRDVLPHLFARVEEIDRHAGWRGSMRSRAREHVLGALRLPRVEGERHVGEERWGVLSVWEWG